MNGTKIKLVKDSLKQMLSMFKENDRISIVTFSHVAQRITKLLTVSAKNKTVFESAINQIDANGGTNIELGMNEAFKIIKYRKFKNTLTSVFLFTDGLDNLAQEKVAA